MQLQPVRSLQAGPGVNTATGEAIAFADAAQTGTTFQMPAGSVKVTASYEAVIQTYRVSVANGTINGAASEMTVDQGTQVTIAANPIRQGRHSQDGRLQMRQVMQ